MAPNQFNKQDKFDCPSGNTYTSVMPIIEFANHNSVEELPTIKASLELSGAAK